MESEIRSRTAQPGFSGPGHGSGSTGQTRLKGHTPPRVRFKRPYVFTMEAPDLAGQMLTIKQAPFSHEGFASTVWDSSIVMARYFEMHGAELRGKRCLDLSAGCGLVGVVMGKLGAEVWATDLEPNLALLRDNLAANGIQCTTKEHNWGEAMDKMGGPFDIIVACDVMYIEDLVQPLLASLGALSHERSEVFLAYGRNRQAEDRFFMACAGRFACSDVPESKLHPVYQCSDVRVLKLHKLAG